jgi:hypothetical protein
MYKLKENLYDASICLQSLSFRNKTLFSQSYKVLKLKPFRKRLHVSDSVSDSVYDLIERQIGMQFIFLYQWKPSVYTCQKWCVLMDPCFGLIQKPRHLSALKVHRSFT